jgi:hypothetical protein
MKWGIGNMLVIPFLYKLFHYILDEDETIIARCVDPVLEEHHGLDMEGFFSLVPHTRPGGEDRQGGV